MFKFEFRQLIILACYAFHISARTPNPRNGLLNDYSNLCSKLWSIKERLLIIQLTLLQNDATEVSAVLRKEFFTLATGEHYRFPIPDDETDKEHHKIASTVARLWLDLRYGKKADAIIEDVTLEIGKTVPTNVDTRDLEQILNALYRSLRQRIRNDAELDSAYQRLAAENEAAREDPSVEVEYVRSKCAEGVLTYWNASSTFRKFYVNKLFLNLLAANESKSDLEKKYSEMARLMVQMVANNASKVQEVYDQAIVEVANEIYPTYAWIHEPPDGSPTDDVTPALFTKLEKKLRDFLEQTP